MKAEAKRNKGNIIGNANRQISGSKDFERLAD
jgi:hypothetical protein